MLRLLDGPCEGTYACKRAPLYLRAVRHERTGDRDVLDLLDDVPLDSEAIHVYRRVGEAGAVHLNRGRHGSGFYALGDYAHLPGVDGEAMRGAAAWREWCASQPADA